MHRWLIFPLIISACFVVYDYYVNPTGWYDLALFFAPVTFILTMLLMRRLPLGTSSDIDTVEWQPLTRGQVIATIAGIVCFFLVLQVQGDEPQLLGFLFGMHHAHQLLLFALGILLIGWGMAGGLHLTGAWQAIRRWITSSDAKWVLVFVVIGLFIRSISLETAVQYYTDETNFASAMTRLRNNPDIQIMDNICPIANFTWIYAYFQYYFTEAFGATLGNLRAVSVIVGTITIPAMYALGRVVFSRRIGIISAFLIAIFLPHVHFSRLAFNNIVDPLLAIVTITLLWRAIQSRDRRCFALAGVCLGLTSYFYEGGRLLYPVLMISWLVFYNFIGKHEISKRGLGIFVVSFVLISSCFYLSLGVSDFQNVAPRFLHQNVSNNFWTKILTNPDVFEQVLTFFDERLNPPYLHIMSQPDGSEFYYSTQVGLILPHLLPFLFVGLGVSLYQWRRIGLLLIMWFMLTILGNSLIIWNDWTPRFVVLFPALILFIALGLDLVCHVIEDCFIKSKQARWLFTRLIIVSSILLSVGNFVYYFGVMLQPYNLVIRYEMDDQDASRRAQALPVNTEVHILPMHNIFHADVEVIQAYEHHIIPVTVTDTSYFDFSRIDPNAKHPYAFFVVPEDTETMATLTQLFANQLDGPYGSPYNIPDRRQFALYFVDQH